MFKLFNEPTSTRLIANEPKEDKVFSHDKNKRLKLKLTPILEMNNYFKSHLNKPNVYTECMFRNYQKTAVVSGAGIAGLVASLVLISRGYRVMIIEKRDSFTRSNVINLDVDVQVFLRKFNLLEAFETHVAAKIKSHKILHFTQSGGKVIDFNDMSDDESKAKSSKEMDEAAKEGVDLTKMENVLSRDGYYSVTIKDLQNFLA